MKVSNHNNFLFKNEKFILQTSKCNTTLLEFFFLFKEIYLNPLLFWKSHEKLASEITITLITTLKFIK